MRELTVAEKAIIDEMVKNPAITVKELAMVLDKSPKTIENQLSSIFRRYNIEGNSKTIQLYMKLGWINTKPIN